MRQIEDLLTTAEEADANEDTANNAAANSAADEAMKYAEQAKQSLE